MRNSGYSLSSGSSTRWKASETAVLNANALRQEALSLVRGIDSSNLLPQERALLAEITGGD